MELDAAISLEPRELRLRRRIDALLGRLEERERRVAVLEQRLKTKERRIIELCEQLRARSGV